MIKTMLSKLYFNTLLLFLPTLALSQCQVFDDNLAGGVGLSGDVVSIAQGFIAECDGRLEYAQFLSSSNATSEVFGTFKLYEGNGLDGTLLYTEPYASGTIFMLNDPIRAVLSNDVELVQGNQYTFELIIDNQVGIRTDSDMTYLGGSAFTQGFESSQYDFNFEVSIVPILGLSNFDPEVPAVVYPNPAKEHVRVSGIVETVKYKIYSIRGVELLEGNMVPNQTIAIEQLPNGVYFLQFEQGPTIQFIRELQ